MTLFGYMCETIECFWVMDCVVGRLRCPTEEVSNRLPASVVDAARSP